MSPTLAGDPGAAWSPKAVASLAAAVLLVGVGLVQWSRIRTRDEPVELRVASGRPGGTYHPLGLELCHILERELEGTRALLLQTDGSRENVELLTTGGADLALVQNDTPGHAEMRTIAPLYDEILHLVVRADASPPIESILDLEGRPVAIGPRGSGTRVVVEKVLRHFGLEVHASSTADRSTEDSIEAFTNGELDAVFLLSALGSGSANELCRSSGGRLLAVGPPGDAFGRLFPFLHSISIPQNAYGEHPSAPVPTLAVSALLVARRELGSELVRATTEALFTNKMQLAEHLPIAADFGERYDTASAHFAFHEGAVDYYKRNEPSLLVRYAEVMSFVFTLVVALGSATIGTREWLRRRKKNRIDLYYIGLNRVSQQAADAPAAQLVDLRKQLHGMRRRAFEELVAERLEANESFTIFQTFLRAELQEIDARLGALQRDPEGGGSR